MRFFVSWITDDGTASEGMEWLGFFQEQQMLAVGDYYVEPFGNGEMGVARVIERYIYLDEDDDEIWHVFMQTVEVPPDRQRAFQLREVVEIDFGGTKKMPDIAKAKPARRAPRKR
jgi:hypothetical protein